MLEEIERDGLGHIISWQSHGRCFVIRKPKEFVSHIMPTYFNQSKLPSFQRQLNLYGFQRLTKGPDKGAYYNELFLRGKFFLCHQIQRVRVKGTLVRARSSPETEPDFRKMPPVVTSSNHVEEKHGNQLEFSENHICKDFNINDIDNNGLVDFEGMSFHLIDDLDLRARKSLNVGHEDSPWLGRFLTNLDISKELYQSIVDGADNDDDLAELLQYLMD